MSEGVYAAKRGGPRLFVQIETAFALLRGFGVAQVEVRIADYVPAPRPYRRGRPEALHQLDRLQRKPPASTPPIKSSEKTQLPLPGVVRGRRAAKGE